MVETIGPAVAALAAGFGGYVAILICRLIPRRIRSRGYRDGYRYGLVIGRIQGKIHRAIAIHRADGPDDWRIPED